MAREMKDSGIEWIGEIPSEWEIRNIKNLFSFGKGLNITKENLKERGIAVISYGQIHSKLNRFFEISDELIRFVDESYLDTDEQSLVNQGDFIFADTSEDVQGCGNFIYVDNQRTLFAGYHTIILHSLTQKDNKFFAFLFMSDCWRKQIRECVSGVKLFSVSQKLIKKTNILIPPEKERTKIVKYLEKHCIVIDTVLKKTRASIEEYKKLKQAVITQAVTKGIRGNGEMKDSGIEWIGEIPLTWELIPFRHVLQERQEKNNPIKSVERLSLSIDLGVTLYAEKTTNLDRFKEDFEQYKLAHKGDLVMNSMNMIVGATGVSSYFGCVSPVYYTFYDELEDHVTAKYCEYIFRSKTMLRVLYSLGKGIYAIVRGDDRVNTCRLKVAKEDLKNIIIPVPSVEEQREIVSYLKQKCEEIDIIISKKEQYLSEIENYKKSLIYEYVTGKKEVP
ncbi:MAG: hypothetical protein HDR02_09990 [Lachnospiraceae bacterium]|nr:hypothetical protein [Lachnospiraceae bacterium]